MRPYLIVKVIEIKINSDNKVHVRTQHETKKNSQGNPVQFPYVELKTNPLTFYRPNINDYVRLMYNINTGIDKQYILAEPMSKQSTSNLTNGEGEIGANNANIQFLLNAVMNLQAQIYNINANITNINSATIDMSASGSILVAGEGATPVITLQDILDATVNLSTGKIELLNEETAQTKLVA